MMRSVWHIKIPTFIGLFLLMLTIAVTILLTKNNPLINIRANPSNVPAFVRVSNITDTSFTVSYMTAESTTGSISFGEKSDGQVVLDDRDKAEGNPASHQLHYFTVTNVKPSTQYYFTLLSGSTTFNNQGSPYSVKTTSKLPDTTPGNQKTIDGTVLLPDGTSPKEAVVYMQTGNSQLLSVPVQNNGSYHIDLNVLRKQSLDQYIQLTDTDQVNLTFIGDGNQATATTTIKDAIHIPAVTLSNQYSFTAESPIAPTSASGSAQPLLQQPTVSQTGNNNLQILIPEKNQSFTDSQPEFSGKALPGSSIDILIQSANEVTDTIQADENGNWIYRLSKPLDPGIHTLTVSGRNASGILQTISQSFIVYAAGSQFTEPSVSPTKSAPTPTTIITTIPTEIPTVIPTTIMSITPLPTIFTPSPALSGFITPSIQPTLAPGSSGMIISAGFISFAAIIGALLFFLIHV